MRIVFDLGGVIYRWRPEEFLVHLLPARALTPERSQALAGAFFQGFDGDWKEFDRGAIEPEPLAARIATRLGLELDEARAVIAAVPDELQPIGGTVALAERLKRAGRTLHFLSNMPRPYADALTRRDRLFELFDGGVFSSHVGLLKPDPAIFAHAADAFDCPPRELLLLDDLERNVIAARQAGWQAIVFRDAAQCAAELMAFGVA